MSAHLKASLDVIEELYDSMTDLVRGLDSETLNWTPNGIDATNSIAAMVTHTVGSTNSWTARAVSEPIERDRDAEFKAQAGARQLVELIDRGRADLRRRFALLESIDLGSTIVVTRLGGAHAGSTQEVSVGWCIEHALIHAGEHWGQIQLTRQLRLARG